MNKWADMWESLVKSGVSESEATAQVTAAQQAETQKPSAPTGGAYPQSVGTPDFSKATIDMRKAPGAVMGGLYQAARGATGGLIDRGVAAGVAALSPELDYRQARRQVDDQNRAYADAHPVANVAANIGGAMLGPSPIASAAAKAARMIGPAAQGAGLLARGGRALARGAAGGALGGGVAGVGYQDGDDDASPLATAGNAATGLGLGAVGGAALTTAGAAARPVGRVLADLSGARQLFSGGSVGANQVPRAPGTGTAAQKLYDGLEGRLFPVQAGRRADAMVQDAITKQGDTPLNVVLGRTQVGNALSGGNAMVADEGGKFGERLARGVKNKSVNASEVLEQAVKNRQGKLLTNFQGAVEDLTGAPVNTVKLTRELGKEATDVGNAKFGPIKDDVFQLDDATRAQLLDRDPRGVLPAVHRMARNLSKETDGVAIPELFTKLDDGSVAMVDRPLTIREVDFMRRAISEMSASKAQGGKGLGKLTAKNAMARLDEMIAPAKQQVPDYDPALKAVGAVKQQQEAVKLAEKGGRRFGSAEVVPAFKSASPNEVRDVVERMSPDAADRYRQGVGSSLYRDATKGSSSLKRVIRDFGRAEGAQQKVRATDNSKGFQNSERFTDQMKTLDEMVQRDDRIMSGSVTAESMNDPTSAAISNNLGQFVYAAGRAAGNIAAGRSLGGLQRKTAEQIGNRMALTGDDAESFIRYLSQLDQYNTGRNATRGTGSRSALAALLGMENNR